MAGESSEIQRGEYLPRVADGLLTRALQSSGAVQIKGPKWVWQDCNGRKAVGESGLHAGPGSQCYAVGLG